MMLSCDDVEEPYCVILQLDDGRVVFGDECQYSPAVLGRPSPSTGGIIRQAQHMTHHLVTTMKSVTGDDSHNSCRMG